MKSLSKTFGLKFSCTSLSTVPTKLQGTGIEDNAGLWWYEMILANNIGNCHPGEEFSRFVRWHRGLRSSSLQS